MDLRKQSVLFAAGAALCWGLMDALAKIPTQELDSVSLSFTRGFLIVVGLLAANEAFIRQKIDSKNAFSKVMWLYGITFVFGSVGLFFSIGKIGVGTAVFLMYTSPIIASAIAFFFLGEHLSPKKIAALLFGVAGVYLLYSPTSGVSEIGIAAGIFAAINLAIYTVAARKFSSKISTTEATFWMVAIQTALMVPFANYGSITSMSGISFLAMIGLAILFIAGNMLLLTAMRGLDVATASTTMLLEPLGAAAAGMLIFSESHSSTAMAGFALIGIGALLVAVQEGRKSNRGKK